MANPMTLKRFLELAQMGRHQTWEDVFRTLNVQALALKRAQDRVEQLNDDLDRLYEARNRRRARWANFGLAILHGAVGAAVLLGGLYAREAGLWPW